MKSSRLLLADRHLGMLGGVQSLFEDLFDSIVMVVDERSLLEAVTDLAPDLVIMDLLLSGGQGVELAERLLTSHPALRLIVLSVHEEASLADRVMATGVAGFVSKLAVGTDLLPAVRAVLAGGAFVSPAVPGGDKLLEKAAGIALAGSIDRNRPQSSSSPGMLEPRSVNE
jgi:DNA-binding NarL/FixJ family response regulator